MARPLPNGLLAWYKADSITGVSNGGTVSTWPDSSGNGYTMSAGTAPVFRTNELNGLPAVDFSSSKTMDSLAPATGTSFTVFVVIRQVSLGTYYPIRPSVNGGVLLRTLSNGRTQFGIAGQTFPSASSTAANVNTSTYTIQSAEWDGSQIVHYANGTNVNSVNPTTFTATTSGSPTFVINTYEGLNAEIIIYNKALSNFDRAQVHSYLNDKYNISVSDYTFGNIKVWDGSSWVAKPVKVWDGSDWTPYFLNYWSGSSWLTTDY